MISSVDPLQAAKIAQGITSGLLLMLLGVPDETIIADYSITNLYYTHLKDSMRSTMRKLRVFRITLNDLLPALTARIQN